MLFQKHWVLKLIDRVTTNRRKYISNTFSLSSRLALAPNNTSTISWYPDSTAIWRGVCCLYRKYNHIKFEKCLSKHTHVPQDLALKNRLDIGCFKSLSTESNFQIYEYRRTIKRLTLRTNDSRGDRAVGYSVHHAVGCFNPSCDQLHC